MVNPIAKKRFEDQRNTYIAEDRKLRELGEKRKTEEKEREEFVKGLAEEMPMKMVTEPMSSVTAPGEGKLFEEIKDFAGIGDKKDEKWEQEFISGFKENEGIEVKEEKKPKTTNQKNIVINQRNDTIMAAYESGEKWLMSEGEDDFIKALINNFRSAMGKAVEDLAYAINDIAPWYKPAGNVLEKNTAGKINDMAEKQFGNAKEKTGDFGDSMIDLADMASEELGYMVFGPKAGSFISDLGQGFAKYQNLREQGYGKDEALFESSKDLARAIATENVGNKFWRNGKVDERLFGKNGIVDKAVDIEYNRANVFREKGERRFYIKKERIREIVENMVDLIDFVYDEKWGNVEYIYFPEENKTKCLLYFDGYEIWVETMDEIMNTPFIDGKSFNEVADDIVFYWGQEELF